MPKFPAIPVFAVSSLAACTPHLEVVPCLPEEAEFLEAVQATMLSQKDNVFKVLGRWEEDLSFHPPQVMEDLEKTTLGENMFCGENTDPLAPSAGSAFIKSGEILIAVDSSEFDQTFSQYEQYGWVADYTPEELQTMVEEEYGYNAENPMDWDQGSPLMNPIGRAIYVYYSGAMAQMGGIMCHEQAHVTAQMEHDDKAVDEAFAHCSNYYECKDVDDIYTFGVACSEGMSRHASNLMWAVTTENFSVLE